MTKVERVPIEENPESLGLRYEDVSFSRRDNELTLRGWYLPAQNSEQVIIMVHDELSTDLLNMTKHSAGK